MYKVNNEKVFYDTSDGETIVVNFITGNYYCFNQMGTTIFDYLTKGGDPDKIALPNLEALSIFIKTLEDKELLKKDQESYLNNNFEYTSDINELPLVTEYDEVKNLILADPIIEVSNE